MAERNCPPGACDIKAGLLDCIDSVLSVRECIGAQLADVSIITRTWTGSRVGEGTYTETVNEVHPAPEIKDYSHDIRVTSAGAVKQGDLLLKGISKNQFDEATLKTTTSAKNIEKLIKVGNHYYRTIYIKENLVTWDIQVRKVLKDENE